MLLHKIVSIGNSRGVIIPAQFFDYWIKQGKTIDEVGIEINNEIIIRPLFKDIHYAPNNQSSHVNNEDGLGVQK